MPYTGMLDNVYNASLSGYPYQLAKDCLSGDLRDYRFFATSDNDFYLVLTDNIEGISYEGNCDLYYIEHVFPVDAPDYFQCTFYTDQHINITNPYGYIIYGSDKGMPDLRGGTEKYAVFLCCFAVGAAVFVLIDRIFRRLY